MDLERAFAHVLGGVAPGGDVEGRWGSVDGSSWTPEVHVSDHLTLPLRLRGTRPQPGPREGTILVPDVPEEEYRGRDAQIEAGVAECLRMLTE